MKTKPLALIALLVLGWLVFTDFQVATASSIEM